MSGEASSNRLEYEQFGRGTCETCQHHRLWRSTGASKIEGCEMTQTSIIQARWGGGCGQAGRFWKQKIEVIDAVG